MTDLRTAEGRAQRLAESVVQSGYAGLVLDRLAKQASELFDGDGTCLTARGPAARTTVTARRDVGCTGRSPTATGTQTLNARESRVLAELAALADAARDHPRPASELFPQVRERLLALVEAMEAGDGCTATHSRSVGELTRAVGERLGLGAPDLLELELAALFHDVGKLVIPDPILTKPGPLGPDEQAIMRRHPEWGATLLATVPGLQPVATIVRYHHERWDGTGYPSGLAGDRIPLASRVVAICDAYDAMVSGRPYRRALPQDLAAEELRAGAGSQFDPRLVELVLAELATTGESRMERELWLSADPAELAHARGFTDAAAAAAGLGADERFAVVFAVNEVVENAIEHGTPSGGGRVHLRAAEEDQALVFYVRDFGRFTPDAPTGEGLPERGRGLPLVAAMTDEMAIRTEANGTVVRLAKRLSTRAPRAAATAGDR